MKGTVQIQVRDEQGALVHGVRYDVDDVDAALEDLKDCQGDTDATDDQLAGGARSLEQGGGPAAAGGDQVAGNQQLEQLEDRARPAGADAVPAKRARKRAAKKSRR